MNALVDTTRSTRLDIVAQTRVSRVQRARTSWLRRVGAATSGCRGRRARPRLRTMCHYIQCSSANGYGAIGYNTHYATPRPAAPPQPVRREESLRSVCGGIAAPARAGRGWCLRVPGPLTAAPVPSSQPRRGPRHPASWPGSPPGAETHRPVAYFCIRTSTS